MPVEATVDDEDIVAEEQEGSGENSNNGNGDNGEAGMGWIWEIWGRKWRNMLGSFDFGEEIHGKEGFWEMDVDRS